MLVLESSEDQLIAALANTGLATIILAPGTYAHTRELRIARNLTLQAEVWGKVILHGSGITPFLTGT